MAEGAVTGDAKMNEAPETEQMKSEGSPSIEEMKSMGLPTEFLPTAQWKHRSKMLPPIPQTVTPRASAVDPLSCEVCGIQSTNKLNKELHLKGAKHSRMVKSKALLDELRKGGRHLPKGTKPDSVFRCEACADVVLASVFVMATHIQGSRHKQVMRKAAQEEKKFQNRDALVLVDYRQRQVVLREDSDKCRAAKELKRAEKPVKEESAQEAVADSTSTDTTPTPAPAAETGSTVATSEKNTDAANVADATKRPATAVADSVKPAKKKPCPEPSRCDVCDVPLNSASQREMHMQSKKHQARASGTLVARGRHFGLGFRSGRGGGFNPIGGNNAPYSGRGGWRGGSDGRGRGGDARGRGDWRGRGRGDSAGRGRGDYSFGTGRGDFSRGRGDFNRGRGDSSRGRGDSSRGRGDFNRGRGAERGAPFGGGRGMGDSRGGGYGAGWGNSRGGSAGGGWTSTTGGTTSAPVTTQQSRGGTSNTSSWSRGGAAGGGFVSYSTSSANTGSSTVAGGNGGYNNFNSQTQSAGSNYGGYNTYGTGNMGGNNSGLNWESPNSAAAYNAGYYTGAGYGGYDYSAAYGAQYDPSAAYSAAAQYTAGPAATAGGAQFTTSFTQYNTAASYGDTSKGALRGTPFSSAAAPAAADGTQPAYVTPNDKK